MILACLFVAPTGQMGGAFTPQKRWRYVAVYNHSWSSNCEYEMDYEYGTITIKTIRAIEAGEELFTNCNGNPEDKKPLWFEAK